jgi:hypothetical protein
MQCERIFGTDLFWICLMAHPETDDVSHWVFDVSLFPRASKFGTFNSLAVRETQVSGWFTTPDDALDQGELLGMQLADRHRERTP